MARSCSEGMAAFLFRENVRLIDVKMQPRQSLDDATHRVATTAPEIMPMSRPTAPFIAPLLALVASAASAAGDKRAVPVHETGGADMTPWLAVAAVAMIAMLALAHWSVMRRR